MTSETCTWIFLRGLARETGHWGDFVQQFQAAMPSSRVIALDFPGNGYLNHLTSLVDVPAMAEQCRAQLAAMNVAPPYRLLAISLGGMVAVAWAQAHPQEVTAQVLINTSMRPFSPFHERLRPANYWTLLQLLVFNGSVVSWERAILQITSNRSDNGILMHWLALRRASPVSRTNTLRQLIAAARFVAPLRKPGVPTLLVGSEQDRLVSIQCSHAIARHWSCSLRLHPDAGHDLPLDDGPWLAEQVREWTIVRKGFIS